ncbi:MAG: DUF3006 domain-containing protein [Elusimicrobia bacterium]|nr:DUF3006 domain-containing protein [Elusimicrobiota bacterium]
MKGFVDRIEEGIAIIIFKKGGRMEVPVKNFPFRLKEGDFLEIELRRDDEEKKRVKKRIAQIRKKLKKHK